MSETTAPKKGTVRAGAERYRKLHDESGQRLPRPIFDPSEPETDAPGTEVME
ncbi:hypothetical protein ACIQVL_49900 [Streptomyces sp. NPDC090499]|uniref:hypothetical protein n=1 Tax=Streptomyces sp. NPDC090499 TaxID=3365965 RepID=UPI00380E2775